MRISHFIAGFCVVAGIACDSGIDPALTPTFAIYFLKDPNTVASQVWNTTLSSLELADTPLLTQKDIRSYRWQTHEIAVTTPVETKLVALRNQIGPVGGIPFVVTVGRDRIYLGAFWYAYSSIAPIVPYIDVILDPHRICASWSTQNLGDMRNDRRIYDALKSAGVLVE